MGWINPQKYQVMKKFIILLLLAVPAFSFSQIINLSEDFKDVYTN